MLFEIEDVIGAAARLACMTLPDRNDTTGRDDALFGDIVIFPARGMEPGDDVRAAGIRFRHEFALWLKDGRANQTTLILAQGRVGGNNSNVKIS